MALEYGFSLATIAHRLRRFRYFHALAKWVRRDFWSGLLEGYVEFLRWAFRFSQKWGPPSQTFSIYQALRTGDPGLPGRIVLEDQGVPIVNPDSLFRRPYYNQHKEQPWPVFWSKHAAAKLAAESLALMDGKSVCIESVYQFKRLRLDPAYRFFQLPKPVKLSGNWTSIVSRWVPTNVFPNYTHWLLDALPRLALWPEFPPDTQILIPERLFPSQKESLAMLGVLDRCRFTSETHLEIEQYYFSSPTAMLDCYNPYAVNFLRRSFLPKADPDYSGPKKFFVTRTGSVRNLNNMAEVHDFFTRLGWALVQPAELTFAQQIKLFSEAEAICGTVGSGMTNAVFCKPGCQIVLLAQDFMADSWLEWISQVIKADFHFLLCPSGYRQVIQPGLDRVKELFAGLGHVTSATGSISHPPKNSN
jgi:hypothetical protein